MYSILCISTVQIVSFIVLLAVAAGIIFLCGFLKNRIANKNELSQEIVYSINMDSEDNSVKAEGVSLLAKRKYIVSEQNKIKPIPYTLIDAKNAVIAINDVKVIFKSGDVIEFKDGDTVSAIDENVILAFE